MRYKNDNFLLEKAEDPDHLKVAKQHRGFDIERLICCSGSRVFKNGIYAFKDAHNVEVHRSLRRPESGVSSIRDLLD